MKEKQNPPTNCYFISKFERFRDAKVNLFSHFLRICPPTIFAHKCLFSENLEKKRKTT
jgi:hypothetical protein